MPDEAFYEFHNGDSFLHICIIFVAVVMEGDKVTIIFVDPGSGNYRASQVTPDIFCNGFGVTFVRLGIYVEAVLMLAVAAGFCFFERGADFRFHFIKECGTESIAQESIVKMLDMAPEAIITNPAFRNETVDMRIPFEVSAECM